MSNADPEWMRNDQNKYSLGGTLDVDSVYAGNAGQNISGVEIRIFEDDSYNAGSDNFSGSEINLNLSYMSDSLSNWTPFSRSVVSSDIDGIKIQTDSSQPFYLQYKSWNEGRSSYYPVVDSRGTAYNDYAGYPGQTIQLLSISALGEKKSARYGTSFLLIIEDSVENLECASPLPFCLKK